MIIRLSTENIVEHWEAIKYAAVKVSVTNEKHTSKYCTQLLKNLLIGKAQAWFCMEERRLKTVIITRMQTDIAGLPHLLVDVAYGYKPSAESDKEEFIEKMLLFARNIGCLSVIALSSNPMAINAMKKMGMKKAFEAYMKEVEG